MPLIDYFEKDKAVAMEYYANVVDFPKPKLPRRGRLTSGKRSCWLEKRTWSVGDASMISGLSVNYWAMSYLVLFWFLFIFSWVFFFPIILRVTLLNRMEFSRDLNGADRCGHYPKKDGDVSPKDVSHPRKIPAIDSRSRSSSWDRSKPMSRKDVVLLL